MKPWTEARNNKYMTYNSKLTYQLSIWNVSRKHIVHLTGLDAYSSTYCKWTDKCAGTMGVDQLPSTVSL